MDTDGLNATQAAAYVAISSTQAALRMPDKAIIDEVAAAALIGVEPHEMRTMIRAGRAPGRVFGTRTYRVPRGYLLRWWEAQRPPPPAAKHTHVSVRRRFAVLERCGFACVYCGRRPPEVVLHVDHVHPRSAGGGHDDDNLVAACRDCNLGKAARTGVRP